jgi:hypothetical protein
VYSGSDEDKASMPLSTNADKQARALDYILDATRNLFIGLVVGVSLCSFAARAENVLALPSSSADGVISGVTAGVSILFIVVSAIVHAYMVYRHNRLLNFSSAWWYTIPLGATLLICVPIIVYLALLY